MKKYIKWELNNEEPLNPADPLGELTIIGDQGIFKEQDVFLDSFLEAFIEGLNLIKTQDVCNIEIIDEPDELIFTKNGIGFQIQYKEQNVTISNIKLFSIQLSDSVHSFLQILDEASERIGKKKYNFSKMREYVE